MVSEPQTPPVSFIYFGTSFIEKLNPKTAVKPINKECNNKWEKNVYSLSGMRKIQPRS